MGNRLSKIYTRTGDKGTTGLGDGARVDKDDLRVEAFGTVDELNSAIGLVLAAKLPQAVRNCLDRTQHELFDLGGELCMPGYTLIPDSYAEGLEKDLDHFNEDLPPLKDFILPGGSEAAARCHLARTIARRAERRVVSLSRDEEILEMVEETLAGEAPVVSHVVVLKANTRKGALEEAEGLDLLLGVGFDTALASDKSACWGTSDALSSSSSD